MQNEKIEVPYIKHRHSRVPFLLIPYPPVNPNTFLPNDLLFQHSALYS